MSRAALRHDPVDGEVQRPAHAHVIERRSAHVQEHVARVGVRIGVQPRSVTRPHLRGAERVEIHPRQIHRAAVDRRELRPHRVVAHDDAVGEAVRAVGRPDPEVRVADERAAAARIPPLDPVRARAGQRARPHQRPRAPGRHHERVDQLVQELDVAPAQVDGHGARGVIDLDADRQIAVRCTAPRRVALGQLQLVVAAVGHDSNAVAVEDASEMRHVELHHLRGARRQLRRPTSPPRSGPPTPSGPAPGRASRGPPAACGGPARRDRPRGEPRAALAAVRPPWRDPSGSAYTSKPVTIS
jgi:hypothetical protein